MRMLNINSNQCIPFLVTSGCIRNLFLIDNVNIYIFTIFFSLDFARWESVGLPHISCIVIQ